MKTITAAILVLKILYEVGRPIAEWLRGQKLKGKLREEDAKRFVELDRAFLRANSDSVRDDDADLFRDSDP